MEKWTRVLISCVIMYVTRGGEGVKKSEIFMDVIDGSPLSVRGKKEIIFTQLTY